MSAKIEALGFAVQSFFPSVSKWKRFLNQDQVGIKKDAYLTQNKVLNQVVVGHNPSLSQLFTDKSFTISQNIDQHNLTSTLSINPEIQGLSNFKVSSKKSELENVQEINFDLESPLCYSIAGSPSKKVTVNISLIDDKVTATYDDTITNKLKIPDNILEILCKRIELDFQFDTKNNQIKGKLKNFDFTLHNVDEKGLSSEKIWKAMTGNGGDQDKFVFPIEISEN